MAICAGGNIDVGPQCPVSGAEADSDYTRVSQSNPANNTGVIDCVSLRMRCEGDAQAFEVGMFDDEGSNVLSCANGYHASISVDTISEDCHQFNDPGDFTAFSVTAGQYGGNYRGVSAVVSIGYEGTSPTTGMWYVAGDNIPCSSVSFTSSAAFDLDIYFTGTAAAGEDITVTERLAVIDVAAATVTSLEELAPTDKAGFGDEVKMMTALGVLVEERLGLGETVTIEELPPGITYSMGDFAALPANNDDLETAFTESDYDDVVASGDGNYVSQQATDEFAGVMCKRENNNNTDAIGYNFRYKTNLAPTSSTVYLYIWNHTTSDWDEVTSDSTGSADTWYSFTGTVLANLTDYWHWEAAKSAYEATFLITQEAA